MYQRMQEKMSAFIAQPPP